MAFCQKHLKAPHQIRWSFLTVLVTFYSGLSDHFNIKAGAVKTRGVTQESKRLNIWDESKRNLTLTLFDRISIKLHRHPVFLLTHRLTSRYFFGSNVIFILSLRQIKRYCFILKNIWGKPRQIKIYGFILFCWVVSLWKQNVYDPKFSYVTMKQLHSDGNSFLSAQGASALAADLKQTVFITHPSRSKVTQEGELSWSDCDTNHLNSGASAIRVQRKRQIFQTLLRLNKWKELMVMTVVVILISSSLPHWLFSPSAKGFMKWKHIAF